MLKVTITPKCQRAKNRVKEHGSVMLLVQVGQFDSKPAALVKSINDTCWGAKWIGWFTADEAEIKEVSV